MSPRSDDTRHVSKLSQLSQTLSRWKNRSRESLKNDDTASQHDSQSPKSERSLGRRKSSISSFTSFITTSASSSERSLKTMARAKTMDDELTISYPKSRGRQDAQLASDTYPRRCSYSGANASYSSLIDITEEQKPATAPAPKKQVTLTPKTPVAATDATPTTQPKTMTTITPKAQTTIQQETTLLRTVPMHAMATKMPYQSHRLSMSVVTSVPNFSTSRPARPASMSLSPALPTRSAKRASVLLPGPFSHRPTARAEPESDSSSSGSDDIFSDTEDPYVDPTINLDEYDEDEAEIFCKTPVKHKVVCITCGDKFDTIDECFVHREDHHMRSTSRRPSAPLSHATMKRPASIAVDTAKERASLVQTKIKRAPSSRHSWSVRGAGRV